MTGPAVDLAAVRDARRALVAIVAAHPELTRPAARTRLAANLPEIITMKPLDPNATGAARTITVRLSADLIAHLATERDRLAALVPGSTIGLSDAVRSFILRAVATPATIAPAASPAPAPVRPVVVVAPAPDTRQLELVAPVVALHNAANGANVATHTANDDAAPTPRRNRGGRAVTAAVDLPTLKRRLDAAIKAGSSLRAIAGDAGVNEATLRYWRNGKRAAISDDTARALDPALSRAGF